MKWNYSILWYFSSPLINDRTPETFGSLTVITRGDQKVRGKVLLNHIAFIDCNENS